MVHSQLDEHYHRSILLPVLATCLGYMCMALSQVIAKFLGGGYHFSETVFFSQIALIVFSLIYGLKTEGAKKCLHTNKPKLMLWRGFIGKMMLFCNFFALPHIELTTFYTIVFTAPLWIIILSGVILKDKVEPKRLVAALAGLGVVVYIFKPWNVQIDMWTIIAFVGAICSAIEIITIRYIGKEESRSFMVGIGAIVGLIMIAPFMVGHFKTPTLIDVSLMFSSGLLMVFELLLLAYAYQNVTAAAQVAPYQYTQIVWGAMFGYLLFNQLPNLDTVIGATLIIAIGIYLILSDRKFTYKKGKIVVKKNKHLKTNR